MADLTVVIPTHQDGIRLKSCVSTLYAYAPGSHQVVLSCQQIDQTMQDCVEVLQREYGKRGLSAVLWDSNDFGDVDRHINRIFDTACTPYVAWVHDDTLFVPSGRDFWKELIAIAADPGVGLVGSCSDNAEALQNVAMMHVPEVVVAGNIHVPLVLCRRAFFAEMKGLCEDLRQGTGIVDLCVRSIAAGYKNVVNRRVFLHHQAGGTYSTIVTDPVVRKEWLKGLAELGANEIIARNGLKAFIAMHEIDMTAGTADILYGELSWNVRLAAMAAHHYKAYTR